MEISFTPLSSFEKSSDARSDAYNFIMFSCVKALSYIAKSSKYSANCSLFDIVEEDFSNSILMVGGTYTQNNDNFVVNNIFGTDSFTGVDMHASTLMTLLHLNGPLKRLPLSISLFLVFFTFFLSALFIFKLFILMKIENKEKEFFILFLVNTIIFIMISIYLLREQHLWFNWLIPWAVLGLVEFFMITKTWIFKNIIKWRNNE
jgi:hypothetical protein